MVTHYHYASNSDYFFFQNQNEGNVQHFRHVTEELAFPLEKESRRGAGVGGAGRQPPTLLHQIICELDCQFSTTPKFRRR